MNMNMEKSEHGDIICKKLLIWLYSVVKQEVFYHKVGVLTIIETRFALFYKYLALPDWGWHTEEKAGIYAI